MAIAVRATASAGSLGTDSTALVETFSGHIAVLPALPGENLEATPVGKTLVDSGLKPHLVWLTPEQFVDTNFFNAGRFALALYLGYESYLQSVRQPGDGDLALRQYLAGGGALFALPNGPFPFYYNQAGQAVSSAASFGFPIAASSFDVRPAERTLTFHVNTNQTVFRFPQNAFPFPAQYEADPRWRAIGEPKTPGARYTTLVSLRDESGRGYADGAAFIEHVEGPWAGTRLLYVWCSLLADEAVRGAVLRDGFRATLMDRPPPPPRLTCRRTLHPPTIDGRLDDRVWRDVPQSRLFSGRDKDRRQPTHPTTVHARWDDDCLYLGFRCGRGGAGDGGPPGADFVHCISGSDFTGGSLRGFWVSRFNELGIPAYSSKVEDALKPVKTAVTSEALDWTAELAIPWSWWTGASGRPKLDAELSLQFSRIIPGVGETPVEQNFWSVPGEVNQIERFGRLVLVADPLADDFEARSEPAAGSAAWRLTDGTWRLENGTMVGENCVADRYEIRGAARGDENWRDYTLTVRFKIESGGSDWRDGPWFGVRVRPDGDGYYLTFTDRDCQLHKVIYGISTSDSNPLARAAWRPDEAWHTLQVRAQANRLRVQLDEQLLFDVKDDAHLNLPSLRNGGIVLAARKGSAATGKTVVRFDDVEVQLVDE